MNGSTHEFLKAVRPLPSIVLMENNDGDEALFTINGGSFRCEKGAMRVPPEVERRAMAALRRGETVGTTKDSNGAWWGWKVHNGGSFSGSRSFVRVTETRASGEVREKVMEVIGGRTGRVVQGTGSLPHYVSEAVERTPTGGTYSNDRGDTWTWTSTEFETDAPDANIFDVTSFIEHLSSMGGISMVNDIDGGRVVYAFTSNERAKEAAQETLDLFGLRVAGLRTKVKGDRLQVTWKGEKVHG